MANINGNQGGVGNINASPNLLNGQNNGNNDGQQNQNADDDMFGGFELDDEQQELIKGFGGNGEVDLDSIEIDENWFSKGNKDGEEDDDESTDEEDVSKTMLTEIEQAIGKISIHPDSLGENFDASDPKQFAKALSRAAQQGAMSAIALMSKPTKHYVDGIATQLRDEMAKQVRNGTVRNKIQEAFAPFESLKGAARNMATVNFQQALKTTNGDVKRAQQLTRQLLKAVGINVNLRQGNGNSQNQNTGSMLEGVNALDSMFGSNK